MITSCSRKGVVLANKSLSGYGLMLPSQIHYLHIIGLKPLLYYPLSLLMLSGIKNIEILVEERNEKLFSDYLSSISHLGVNFTVKVVSRELSTMDVIYQANSDSCDIAVVEGDLLLVARGLQNELRKYGQDSEVSTFFGMLASNPTRHINFLLDSDSNIVEAVQFPGRKISDFVSPGLFFINNKSIKRYLGGNGLDVSLDYFLTALIKTEDARTNVIGRGGQWIKVTTEVEFEMANELISAIERVTAKKVACLEEISRNYSWLDLEATRNYIKSIGTSEYAEYIRGLLRD